MTDQPAITAADLAGPLRVVAGPGTGKTHALADLYTDLVRSGEAGRDRILVLTFSAGAAQEIARRLDQRLEDSYSTAWISTFHSFCLRLLRDHDADSNRRLLSKFQEWVAMRATLAEIPDGALGELEPVRHSEAFADDVGGFVALLKQNLVHPQPFALLAETAASDRLRALASVYAAYQSRLEEARLVDFRDLVARTIALLDGRPALLSALREQFRYVLVDEFQDVDPAQYALLRLIAPPDSRPRIAVFGDPDQSIYGFRGTQPRLLLEDFPSQYRARTLSLEACRRCPPEVIEGASALLEATDPDREGRSLTSSISRTGRSVHIARETNAVDEAFYVARRIRSLMAERPGLGPGDFAILLRSTRRRAAPFVEAMRALGLPHQVRGMAGLARNRAVRYLLSYLRALQNPSDPDALAAAFESSLSGVDRRAAGRVRAYARAGGRTYLKALQYLLHRLAELDPERFPLPWAAAAGDVPEEPRPLPPGLDLLTEPELLQLHGAMTRFENLRSAARRQPVAALAYAVLIETGALARLLDAGLQERERTRLLAEVRVAVEAFEQLDEVHFRLHGDRPLISSLQGLDQLVARAVDESEASADDSDEGAVQVMTVHQAKGLEFPVVFCSGFANGVFPAPLRSHPLLEEADRRWLERELAGFRPPWPARPEAHQQEEARLAYVAFTRARELLHLTHADEYDRASGPSGFLEAAAFEAVESAYTRAAAELTAHDVLTISEAETLLVLGGGAAGEGASRLAELGVDLEFTTDPEAGRPFRPQRSSPTGVSPHHFSATDLNSYIKCPRLYWYEHHPALNPSPAGPEMERGRFLHQVLEDFHNREPQWRELPLELQRSWLENALEEHLQTYLEHMEGVLDSAREEAEVRAILEQYVRFATSFQKVRRLGTLATEKKFILQLDGAEIHGKIDRINDTGGGTCEVVDYKTGRGLSLGTAYEAYFGPEAHDVQLALYEMACREGVDEEGRPLELTPRHLSLWYPRDWVRGGIRQVLFTLGPTVTGDDRLERGLGAAELEHSRRLVAEAVDGIRAGRFAPDPRPVVGTCIHHTGCRQASVCPYGGSPEE